MKFLLFLLIMISWHTNATNADFDECTETLAVLKEVPPLLMPALSLMNAGTTPEAYQRWTQSKLIPAADVALQKFDERNFPKNKFEYMLFIKAYVTLKNSKLLADDIYYYLKDKTEENKNRIKIKTDFAKKTLFEFEKKCPTEFKGVWK